ncbi:MAG: hypothetical protein IKN94_06085 [Salinivirgaceae bacterium]|nr:hypothetical protein [Salinivirgaceae bacterium]
MKKIFIFIFVTMPLIAPSATKIVKGTTGGHEWVDLSLTSGTLWATCNIGAANPWDYGDYYAWGETETKGYYDWDTYKYYDKDGLFKYYNSRTYGTVNSKTILESDDDAAIANWGNGWLMPTRDDFQELYDECYWEWTDNYSGTNKAGYIVYKSYNKTKDKQTIKESGHAYSIANDTHIFLPAAGCRIELKTIRVGLDGYYWSASIYSVGPAAARICHIYREKVSATGYDERKSGNSVRPIRRSN